MSTRKKRRQRRRTPARRARQPQRWWEILEQGQGAQQPFASYFRDLRPQTDVVEAPWGGDSSLIEGWFEAGEDLTESPDNDAQQWRQEGSLARAWSWMCSHVLPEARTNPAVGQMESDAD